MPDFFQLGVGQSIRSERKTWYRNIQFLGMGGNAITYLVLCTSGPYKGIPFAFKVFRVISRKERKEKFLAERQFLNNICNHPSIMRVFDSGVFQNIRKEDFPFVVSEYLPQTLREIMRQQKTTIVEKISYVLQLLSALSYLNTRKIPVVHRDIKPENIFIKGQSCVLGDFGLMKILDGQDEIDREIFKESIGPGMPFFYRTPDLISYANNKSEITTKSDVFQLGLVATELFTGRNPAIPPSSKNLLAPLRLEAIKPIQSIFGRQIRRLLLCMLEHNPNNRETADQLIDPWQGIFTNAIDKAHELEGKAF